MVITVPNVWRVIMVMMATATSMEAVHACRATQAKTVLAAT